MNSRNNTGPKIIFAGPTLTGMTNDQLLEASEFDLQPPASRGDVERVLNNEPGTIVLVDGRFHQSLAVGHAELRHALEKGWDVWGLSSMGAIRAFEMRKLGMRGFGSVYEYFLGVDDFQDDEVAMLHAADAPYTSISEPLVHLRRCAEWLAAESYLPTNVAQDIVRELKERWYGDRTMALFLALVAKRLGRDGAAAIARELRNFQRFRVKSLDLAEFLFLPSEQRELYAPAPRVPPFCSAALPD